MATLGFINGGNLTSLGIGTTNPATALDVFTGTMNAATVVSVNVSVTGSVGINAGPAGLTETLTVSGNTSFVGSLMTVTDQGSASYVTGLRTPAGSLGVQNYVTGSVPLTTTTNLIQNYLSNAAAVVTNAPTYNPALSLPGTTSSAVNLGANHSTHFDPTSSNIFVEAWVYITTGGAQWIMASSNTTVNTGEDWGFLYNGTTVNFYVFNTSATNSQGFATGFNQNAWYHVAGSWNSVTKTAYAFVSGSVNAGTAITGSMRYFATNTVTIGSYLNNTSNFLKGYIYDLRFLKGSIVPTASFTAPATPTVFGLTAPAYVTGMSTGGSANVALSLQSQYFPGASTSPYGPCLTLPGTVGSYYSIGPNTVFDSVWSTTGFTVEAWVNYASLANSNVATTINFPTTIGHMQPTAGNNDWSIGACTNGALSLYYNGNGTSSAVSTGASAIVTGQWTHIVAQSNGSRIFLFVNGTQRTDLTVQGYANGGTSSAASINAPAVVASGSSLSVISMGQYNSTTNPNFAIAKARLTFGTSGNPALGNVYSSGNFTANPNLGPVPAGATVAWSLNSQYPLPTYPSIQDVTELPQQASSYGSLPTPVGGVTSNTLGPYTSSPSFDSIRFDGTGYIDYGNAATSVMTSNIWASPWTIEGWVYPTTTSVSTPTVFSRNGTGSNNVDMALYINGTTPVFQYGYSVGSTGITGGSTPLNTWSHLAVTYDGTNVNLYTGGARVATPTAAIGANMVFNPTNSTQIGTFQSATYLWSGNLADVRVSNVARYTGSTYTVPSAPFATDANTLLLLKTLAGQVGTTLEVQGRGLQSTSIGAGRVVNSYPPAPMSSYLLDTTSNASVTYGQGKYVASVSTEGDTAANSAWKAFDKNVASYWQCAYYSYSGTSPYRYIGAVRTVDVLGNSYAGEWIQLQLPVSILLSYYTLSMYTNQYGFGTWSLLGSRDGVNWTVVDSRSGVTWVGGPPSSTQTFYTSSTQAYNYYRFVTINVSGDGFAAQYGPSPEEIVFYGVEEGLCITNDSKVGVGIANPQRSLEVAGDLVVGGTISGGAGMGYFRNRIINGDMRIAQRGTSNVVPNGSTQVSTYLIDRFQVFSNVATGVLTQYQTALTASDSPYQIGLRNYANLVVTSGFTASNLVSFVQVIEGYNVADLMWGTSFGSPVTLSFWFRTNAPAGSTFNVALGMFGTQAQYLSTITAPPGTWQYQTITVPPPPNGTAFNSGSAGGVSVHIAPYGLVQTGTGWNATGNAFSTQGSYNWPSLAGNYIHCTGIQLEKGTVASPFEVRPYATELALCQRYYYRIGGDATYQVFGLGSFIGNTTVAQVYIPFPVTMRVGAPGANFSNSAVTTFWFGSGSGATCTAVTQIGNAESRVGNQIQFTTSSAVTAGTGCIIEANNTTSAFLAFSAEL